ncbi:MAG: flavodoxin domain-containing protein [Anaerolineae bacterium]
MPTSVLVAYASKYGSTQEVAEAVAAALRERGLEVEVRPAREVRSLDDYGTIVLGAPLYIGSWLKEARHFLARHQEALAKRPVAVFALGPLSNDEKEMQGSREQLDKQLAKFPWLKPVASAVFVGKFDPAKLRFPDSLLTSLPASPLHGLSASDLRDWAAIHAWASDLATKLPPETR